MEEKILAFRSAFNNLPDEVKEREVKRLNNIVEGKPFIVLEDHELGKIFKFLDVPSLIEFLWKEKRVRVDRSFIYKVLRGQFEYAHGYKIYYEDIE